MRFPVSSNFPLSITIPSVLSINFIIPRFPRFPALEQRENRSMQAIFQRSVVAAAITALSVLVWAESGASPTPAGAREAVSVKLPGTEIGRAHV